MKKSLKDVEVLIREIQRYLAYVEAVRARPPDPPARPEEERSA